MSIYSTRECAHLLSACWRLLALGIRIRDDGTALAQRRKRAADRLLRTLRKNSEISYTM